MRNFRELKIWQKAHNLVLRVYKSTRKFPKEELYGLISQMRRAGVSIPANIAEGCGKKGDADFARFLQISMGSASELEYYFLLSQDLGYLSVEESQNLTADVTEIKRMLTSFIQKLTNKS
jgi:four helix bundle protein